MAYASLAEFLGELAGDGELARIKAEVDPALEVAEITRRAARGNGPALLFENVRGASSALVTNLLGSEARVCRALAIDSLDAIAARIDSLIDEHTPRNWFERLKTSADATGADKFRPKPVKSGPCQQVVRLGRDVELNALPLVSQWPGETGAALTAGLVITHDPAAPDKRSATVCPLVALDLNRLAVIEDPASALARQWGASKQAGQRMPVAVVLGGDPACLVAAHLDLPPGVDFYHLTGLLRAKALDVVTCRTHAFEVPAEADLILEGYLDPDVPPVPVTCGSGGGHLGLARRAPVLQVSAITQRTHAVVPAVIQSHAPGEAGALLKVRERMLLPALRTLAPALVDLHLPALGGSLSYAFASLAKTYAYQARQVASALWGSAALAGARVLVLVDADVDVRDVRGILAEIGAHASPDHDFFSYEGPLAAAGHGGEPAALGRHFGVDATSKLPGEHPGPAAQRFSGSAEIARLVSQRWAEYGLPPERA
ncbi:MAG: UbiD family decarboxylase domain-containing protein [Pirellulales bacterium]